MSHVTANAEHVLSQATAVSQQTRQQAEHVVFQAHAETQQTRQHAEQLVHQAQAEAAQTRIHAEQHEAFVNAHMGELRSELSECLQSQAVFAQALSSQRDIMQTLELNSDTLMQKLRTSEANHAESELVISRLRLQLANQESQNGPEPQQPPVGDITTLLKQVAETARRLEVSAQSFGLSPKGSRKSKPAPKVQASVPIAPSSCSGHAVPSKASSSVPSSQVVFPTFLRGAQPGLGTSAGPPAKVLPPPPPARSASASPQAFQIGTDDEDDEDDDDHDEEGEEERGVVVIPEEMEMSMMMIRSLILMTMCLIPCLPQQLS